MPIEQTTDLLEKLKNVHHDLAECYAHMESPEKKDKVQLMLSYLSAQEKTLAESMEKFKDLANVNTLMTYYSKSPDKEKWEHLASCRISKDISFEDLVTEVLKTGDSYIDILDEICNSSETDSQKKLFKDLLDSATHQRNQLMYNAMTLGDS